MDSEVVQALRAALDDRSEIVRECATWAIFQVSNAELDYRSLVDTQPKAVVITRPEYPDEAFRKKAQGTVMVALLISATGKVVPSDVRQSIPGLDGAAMRCVRDWTFQPAERGGRPVPVVANAPVAFRIY